MRIPARSVIHRIYDAAVSDEKLPISENLSWWESKGQPLPDRPVTVQAIADYSSHDKTSQVASIFGFYQSGQSGTGQTVFTVPYASFFTINPQTTGAASFDPGTGRWGVPATFPRYATTVYQEDALNGFPGDDTPHHVRIYPYKDANGDVIPNAYIAAFSEAMSTKDYNDLVVIIRNVQPATGVSSKLTEAPLA